MADKKSTGKKIIANNKKAYHDYFVDETMEAGIQLFGTEVKSLRQGGVNLKDSYCYIEDGEIFACISLPTKKAISSTVIRCVRKSCSCISVKFCVCSAVSGRRV